jgi:nitrogen regulatory protein PII
MKYIFAVVQPMKLDAIHQALARMDVTRMTVCDAQGYARQRGQLETYRGHEYKTNLLRKVALEIAVNDDFLDRTIQCLEDVARTSADGHIGDGKVFVVPMEQAIQISDGYRGKGAI